MKRFLILLLVLLIIFLTGSRMQAGYNSFISSPITARAQVLPALPGIWIATITPPVIRSNQQIHIVATTASVIGDATNVKIFFNHNLSQQWSLSNVNPTNWSLTLKDQYPLSIQSIYTANFITSYSNGKITNYNKASFQVDNTPPIIISTSPSNNSIFNLNSWNFTNNLKDIGGAGVNISATIANSHLIYAGSPVTGTWSSNSPTQIVFHPSASATSNGIYSFYCYPVDLVGNTNFNMKNTNNYIHFIQNYGINIFSISHQFKPNTQLTPGVPLTVTLTGTLGLSNAYFSVIGSQKITNIKMPETPANSGTYIGTYYITTSDYVLGGIVRGYLKTKTLDASIPFDIAPVVQAVRGKDIFVVSKDDVQTKLLIPDNSFAENVTIEI